MNTIEQFKNECQVFEMKYEYPGYIGNERFGIITSLSSDELSTKYSDIIQDYEPYLLLSPEFGEVRSNFIRNERKHKRRQERTENIFGFDEATENTHEEIIDKTEPLDFILAQEKKKMINDALKKLSVLQRERIEKYYFYGMGLAEIADEEHVNISAVDKSIKSALKKMKLFLKNGCKK